MQPFVWREGMSTEETKDGAYWERNMLALYMAIKLNDIYEGEGYTTDSGWYLHGEYEGWARVISIADGTITFHVPDDFDLGNLPKIEPNWDGHSTEEKWEKMMKFCGCIGTETV
jgi:hypothetical protein